jgi:HSP20 family molecular chaperone IbpA
MTPFIDAIDRLFEELVHDAWRLPGTAQQPRKRESATTLEMQFPITGASCGDVGVATEGQRLTIRVCRTADRVGGREKTTVRQAEEQFEQSLILPAGTEPAGIELRFDPDALRIRITLRSRG